MAPMIHDHDTEPFPPKGSRVSVRDKLNNRSYYFKGIVNEVTKDYVCFDPGCKGFYCLTHLKITMQNKLYPLFLSINKKVFMLL